MKEISQEEKQKIIRALGERGANRPCPRCGNENFTLVGGYFNQTIQTEAQGIVLGGPSIPSVVVVCSRCGYLSQHALGALGLLPKEKV
jgi:predicted nucleic-acid-binding Zn-ribbon protein